MKYLITESQLDNIIFKYLDNQDFVVVGNNISLFFVNSEEDAYSQIRFDEEDAWCGIDEDLVNEISSFFSISYYDSEQVIGRWVGHTLQMNVTTVMTGTFTNLGD
jgi:hypothetical protein